MINHTLAMSESPSAARAAPAFYVVSRKKLAILFIATFWLYAVYWFYKNWSNYKKHFYSSKFNDVRSIWPAARGFFAIFFIHSLFREIKAYGRDNAAVAEWKTGTHAWKLVASLYAGIFFTLLSGRTVKVASADIISLVVVVPLVVQLLRAQDMINLACGDPDGETNSRLTIANYAWIALGLFLWFISIVSLFTRA